MNWYTYTGADKSHRPDASLLRLYLLNKTVEKLSDRSVFSVTLPPVRYKELGTVSVLTFNHKLIQGYSSFINLETKCYHVGFKQHKWCLYICSFFTFFVNIKGLCHTGCITNTHKMSIKVNGIRVFLFSICPYSFWLSENPKIYIECFNN